MAFDYAEMQVVADELITEFGQTGTVTRITAPDPITGGDGRETAHTATLVAMAYSAREIDGTVIMVGDMQIYISAAGLPITPSPGDLVAANGKSFRVINAEPNLYDGQTPVVHIVHGRVSG